MRNFKMIRLPFQENKKNKIILVLTWNMVRAGMLVAMLGVVFVVRPAADAEEAGPDVSVCDSVGSALVGGPLDGEGDSSCSENGEEEKYYAENGEGDGKGNGEHDDELNAYAVAAGYREVKEDVRAQMKYYSVINPVYHKEEILECSNAIVRARKMHKGSVEIIPGAVIQGRAIRQCLTYEDRNVMDTELLKASGQKSTWSGYDVGQLLANGAEVDCRDAGRRTPLVCAAQEGNEDAAMVLLAASADVNAQDKYGNTPLIKAIEAHSYGIMDHLLDLGAKENTPNTGEWTPLMCAVTLSSSKALGLLLKQGVEHLELDAQNEEGNTAVMLAVRLNKNNKAEALIECGARLDLINEKGQTAFDIAKEIHNSQMEMLIEQVEINRLKAKNQAATQCNCVCAIS